MMTEEFRLWSKNFVLICVATFLYFGSFYLLIPTLPQYVAELGGSPGQIGLVMGSFTLAAVVVRPYFGKLADQYGRKVLMLIGAGCFALLFVLYGQMSAIVPLYFVRGAHGVAHSAFLAASAAYIADLAPAHRRGEVMGVYGISTVVAMALFPAWGIAVINYTGSFSVLFIFSVISATAAFLAVTQLKEIGSKADRGKHISIKAVLQRRAIVFCSAALFCGATAYGAVLTFLPIYAPERGIKSFGIFFTVAAVATLASRVFAGKLSDRIGRRRVILPFMALLAVAVFLLPFLHDMYLLLFIGICFGFGFGAFMPTLNALVVDETPPQERGSALGVFTSFTDLGITTGSVVLGLAGDYWGYAAMFSIAGVIIVAGLTFFAVGMPAARPSEIKP